MSRHTKPARPPAPADTPETVAGLLDAGMVRAGTLRDADELLAALDGLCVALTGDYGAEVVRAGRALWMERTRAQRVTTYTPATGYGGIR